MPIFSQWHVLYDREWPNLQLNELTKNMKWKLDTDEFRRCPSTSLLFKCKMYNCKINITVWLACQNLYGQELQQHKKSSPLDCLDASHLGSVHRCLFPCSWTHLFCWISSLSLILCYMASSHLCTEYHSPLRLFKQCIAVSASCTFVCCNHICTVEVFCFHLLGRVPLQLFFFSWRIPRGDKHSMVCILLHVTPCK